MDRVSLRAPAPDELDDLSALCMRSKALWGYDDEFMEACREELALTPVDLEETDVRVADDGNVPVGVVQIQMEGDDAVLEKIFVEPGRVRAGVGELLFRWAAEQAGARGAKKLIIEADPDAVGFYKRMGAREAGATPSVSIPGRMLPRLVLDLE